MKLLGIALERVATVFPDLVLEEPLLQSQRHGERQIRDRVAVAPRRDTLLPNTHEEGTTSNAM